MTSSALSVSSASLAPNRGLNWPAYLVIASGVLIGIGSTMPWFSLFAGLQPYRGTSGLYGQIVLGSGIVAIIAGALLLRSRTKVVSSALVVSGMVLTGFVVWLLAGLMQTYEKLLENPMYVARLEPGLFLAIAGATILTLAAGYTRFASAPQRARRLAGR